MDITDPAVIVGLVGVAAFIGAVVWAELYTRWQRRRVRADESIAPATQPSKQQK